jgi:hypothetical protein
MSAPHPEIPLHLAVRSVDRLLDIDSSPLAGPGIHPEVARALRAEASEHHCRSRFRLEIAVPAADLGRQPEVETAIQTHFQEELAECREELRMLAYKGRWTFALALLAVGLLIAVSEAVLLLGDGRLFTILSESLIIVAWVSLWGPAETLLFARFPVLRQRDLANSLATARVVLKENPAAG